MPTRPHLSKSHAPDALPGSRQQHRIDRRNPYRVMVLAGGESAEREISLESGAAVAQALRAGGHTVQQLDPQEVLDLTSVDWSAIDVAFIALHGVYGEDGQVQEALDQLQVPYTGSNAAASGLAFSKAVAKERFLASEVPTPDYQLLVTGSSDSMLRRAADQVGYPLVVKPDRQGSSLGVSWVNRPEDLPAAWALACRYDSRVLFEQAICGSEWTVALLDGQVLPPIQIGFKAQLFDYQSKYISEQTSYSFGTNTPAAVLRIIEDAARRACHELGTRGIARVDLRLDAASRPWVLEVNTVPGMTHHSLVPKAAARLGWTMTELCERAIESALASVPELANTRHQPHELFFRSPTSGSMPSGVNPS